MHRPSSRAVSVGGGFRGLLLLGVAFHAIYVLSIFDIYFTSPVVPHVESLQYADPLSAPAAASASSGSSLRPPARRVVVFVADGCRADKFFERNASSSHGTGDDDAPGAPAPPPQRVSFLRDIIHQRGSFGVSHTRVPTESRPGHVALFAGMYEDVSAVTKGWQDNPVDFDSVFNQSRRAWLFGSPDIVPMFTRRVPHATATAYSHAEEDFASGDASSLDVWVHDRLRALLEDAAPRDPALDAALRQDQVVIFCHFLGIDTNGHAHRPQSHDYLDNIALVDELVERTVRVLEEFYNHDGQTAYLFTADHGMSNKGAHGDGDPANTRTPLVAWGAGIAGPTPVDAAAADGTLPPKFTLDLPTQSRADIAHQLDVQGAFEAAAAEEWGLTNLVRKDVMQADVAPLISALLGLPYPRNSVGVLPFTYLRPGPYRARAVLSNAQQLRLHALRKEQQKAAHTLVGFRPHGAFRARLPTLYEDTLARWERGDFAAVERQSQELLAICLEALVYLQRYDWFFLLSVIVLGYVGWIAVLVVALAAPSEALAVGELAAAATSDPLFGLAAAACMAFLALEASPWTYFVYLSFPLLFWNLVWRRRGHLWGVLRAAVTRAGAWLDGLWILGSLELVVVAYNRRWLFGVVFGLLALWPLVEGTGRRGPRKSSSSLVSSWTVGCLALAVFPFLPTEYGEDTRLVVLGGLAVMAVGSWASRRRLGQLGLALAPVGLAIVAVVATMSFLGNKQRPPVALTAFNWVLALAPLLVLAARRSPSRSSRAFNSNSTSRLVDVALVLAPPYVLLSIAYEVLFYAALVVTLVAWLERAHDHKKDKKDDDAEDADAAEEVEDATKDDVRRAFIFLLLLQIAFFGTGNVASMSSFEISSTYRFVTVFSPFLMGTLLVLKILIPFLLVASAFCLLVEPQAAMRPPSRQFVLVVAMSDVLALQFLFLVQNEGSWKEIGNSISMYGIVNAQIVFIPLLFFLAARLVRRGGATQGSPPLDSHHLHAKFN